MAWLGHAIDAAQLIEIAPSLAHFGEQGLEQHLDTHGDSATPHLMSCVNIQSATGAKTLLHSILLPVTSQWMKHRIESRRRRECESLVQKGVDLARDLDCGLVSLGQYSSIATRNGRRVNSHGMGITTGNSYTTALAVQAIERALAEQDMDSKHRTLAIVGAAGNIGRACVEIMAPRYVRTILVGSRKRDSCQRLREIAALHAGVEVGVGHNVIAEGDVVLVATNCVRTRLGAACFKRNAIVCDLSVPGNLDAKLCVQRRDLEILSGGIARMPLGEELGIAGFPLPAGHMFACMAEGLLLSYESVRNDDFTGLLSAVNVRRIKQLAARHGFQLADRRICSLSAFAKEAAVDVCE